MDLPLDKGRELRALELLASVFFFPQPEEPGYETTLLLTLTLYRQNGFDPEKTKAELREVFGEIRAAQAPTPGPEVMAKSAEK